ncbi:hyaluronan and proteoglycan link protein 4-like [Hoplias malabaricus]|uniref:hyaluronan and proteoglycan link protein 4-like n=1 Tax=Hoplias malabaricus TaxID=27720 RepID=UPI003461AD93
MFLCVYLLYCLLQENSGCTVDQGLQGSITKSVGESVVLSCSCENLEDKSYTVQWGYTETITHDTYNVQLLVFPEDHKQNQRYRGRVHILNQNPGNVSLIISHLTVEDSGTYLCGVKGKFSSAVSLHVRGPSRTVSNPVINWTIICIVLLLLLLLLGCAAYCCHSAPCERCFSDFCLFMSVV